VKKNDQEAFALLDRAAVSYQLVLTKTDKIKAAGLPRLMTETAEKIRRRSAAFPEILATSSEKSEGIDALRTAILTAASGR
jgi:GTP-binding protein